MGTPAPPPDTALGRAIAAALARDARAGGYRPQPGPDGPASPPARVPAQPSAVRPPAASCPPVADTCPAAPRRSKFGAIPEVVDGLRFDSRGEARRYAALRLREAAGEIADLRCQPRYPLIVNGCEVAAYVADFEYREPATATAKTVEDFKSPATRTRIYRLKAKLFRALYGQAVRETVA